MSDVSRLSDSRRLWREEAAQWWTLLHGEGVTAADRREFLSWVSRSPERIEAYLAMERLMTVLRADAVRWPDTPPETLIREARSSLEPTPVGIGEAGLARPNAPLAASRGPVDRGRRTRRSGWIAAGAVLAAAVAFWLWLPGRAQLYQTRTGEQRSILLADGSRVTLNSASSVVVDLGRRRRVVHLLRGEALFQVSHDPSRPFDVHTDGEVVRAIGTEFDVTMLHRYAAVTVLQGRVAVMSAAQARLPVNPAWFAPPGGAPPGRRPSLEHFPAPPGALVLSVAQRVLITSRGVSAPRPVSNLSATTAWMHDQLVFEHRPLGEVIDELDRDSGQRIVIASAALRARKVTGVVEIDDPGSLLAFLRDVPGVEIHRAGDGASVVTLSSPRAGDAAHMSGAHQPVNQTRP